MKINTRKKSCSIGGTYRLWLYGCNVFLVFVVLTFATLTWITFNDVRMTLIPLDKWEPLVVLIYVGCALQMIDVLFCFYGVWQNHIQLVFIYWVMLLLLTVFDFIFALLWVFRWQLLHKTSSDYILKMIETNYTDPNLCKIWDDVQSEFMCCGVTSYKDWLSIPFWCSQDLGNETILPRSCCHNEFFQCNSSVFSLLDENEMNDYDLGMAHKSSLIIPGCNNAVLLWMHNKGGNMFLIGFCFVILLKITFLIILKTEIREFSMEIDQVRHRNTVCIDRAFSVVERPNCSLFAKYSEQMELLDDSETKISRQSV